MAFALSLWTLLRWYTIYSFTAAFISITSTLLNLNWGIEPLFLRILDSLFSWAVKFSRPYEEEEVDEIPNPTNEKRPTSNTSHRSLIHRDAVEALRKKAEAGPEKREVGLTYLQIIVTDLADYMMAGVESIVEDEVTSSFDAEEIPYWNFLTRTKANYDQVSWRLKLLWFLGFILRYVVLVPVRILILIFGLLFLGVTTFSLSLMPPTWVHHSAVAYWVTLTSFRIIARSCSFFANFHGRENHNSDGGGICVANHTSPIDVVVLNTERVYCLTGQKHPGMLGYVEASLARVIPHIWFNRSEQKDRQAVLKRLREHAEDHTKPPILLFPEGVCVNNTSVMQFRKGSFEASDTIFPIAMRYNSKFADAYWSQDLWLEHVWDMITSWAIVCDVWYLPPVHRKENEAPVDFADRVKAAISTAAGLRFLAWDGFLKQYTVKPKPELAQSEKQRYGERLKAVDSQSHTPLQA